MGRPGLLKNIANMYLMKDGTPFTSQPGWETMQLPDESRNRDGRFAQTVRTPGYKRVDDTAESAPNLAATMTGYQLVKYLQSAKYDRTTLRRTTCRCSALPRCFSTMPRRKPSWER